MSKKSRRPLPSGEDPSSSSHANSAVRLAPLGGVGNFGMNCMMLEDRGQRILLDCGVQFPDKDHYGIDLLIPDFSHILEAPERFAGLVLTHGHEDHIGGVPFLMRAMNRSFPIYGTPFTLALIRKRLKEHNLDRRADLREIKIGESFTVGGMEIEFININHSVPDAVSLAIGTSEGTVIFTGDWRVDYTPVGEEPIDLHRFAELGREGVLALVADSTNVLRKGVNPSEAEVARQLEDIMDLAPGRLLITLFASNVWRTRGILEGARRTGRRVAIIGRSMQQYNEIAAKLGYMPQELLDVIIDPADIGKYPDDELTILVSGTQGEWRSSLTRIANKEHRAIEIKKGDWVVYSCRFIPGNERLIGQVINKLCIQGAHVITDKDRLVHCSGHATCEEMKLLIKLLKPASLIPVHGEFRQIQAHSRLALELGVPRSLIISNGEVIEFRDEQPPRRVGEIPSGCVFVDGKGVGDVETEIMKSRHKLGAAGIVVAALVLDAETNELLSPPEITIQGVALESAHEDLAFGAQTVVIKEIEYLKQNRKPFNTKRVEDGVTRSLARYFRQRVSRKPVIIPIVHELQNDFTG